MSQFSYLNEINNLVSLDGAITKGPMPRWQKKEMDSSSSSINASINASKQKILASSTIVGCNVPSKTPSKKLVAEVIRGKKTPSKTPKKYNASPSTNKGPKTPGGGDRFIPSRSTSNFDLGHFMINQQAALRETTEDSEKQEVTERESEMQRLVGNVGALGNIPSSRILAYSTKAPAAPDSHQNPLKVVYSQIRTPASVKACSRYIPQAPDRILDAPEIVDDYYLNLLDWNVDNILAVALGAHVYLWDAGSGAIEQLLQLEGEDCVCSLSWVPVGNHLAVGTTQGTVELWDCARMKRLRVMCGHSGRVSSLSWNNYVVSSGSRSGQIMHSDVRQRDHMVSMVDGHTHEVCGLKWSTDGKYLASGGNDNLLNIWAVVPGQCYSQNTPVHVFNAHQAAVKALAWCPWQPHLLASGGGTADRCIRVWNVTNGASVSCTDTHSQVCALVWAPQYKELVSGHGYANNQLTIWKYPSMTKQAELVGHSARVLHLALSPDGTTVLSAGADETLRLWKCFVPDPNKKKPANDAKAKPSIMSQCIR